MRNSRATYELANVFHGRKEPKAPLLYRSFDHGRSGISHPGYGLGNGLGTWALVYSLLAESDAERSAYLERRCREPGTWEDEP